MTRRPQPAPPRPSETNTAGLPEGVVPICKPLDAAPRRLTYRLDELAAALGISRRTLERERSVGRFPAPDLRIGKMPLWRPETIRAWIERERERSHRR
jgi:predicted DNA-binding transcriptional regulator AlpA